MSGSSVDPPVLRHELDPGADPASLVYTFGGVEPVVSIRPGTVVSTWTLDCFAGRVRASTDLVSQVCDPRYLNPQTGPFFVEGAEPGDTLAVHFVSIEPRVRVGRQHHRAVVRRAHGHRDHRDAAPRRCPSGRGSTRSTWPAGWSATPRWTPPSRRPAAGPDARDGRGGARRCGEVRSSLAPGDWGGNMDTPEMRAGVTCYLGVNVAGRAVQPRRRARPPG